MYSLPSRSGGEGRGGGVAPPTLAPVRAPNPPRHPPPPTPPRHARRAWREGIKKTCLLPLKLTPYAVAAALNVPRTRIERIAREEKPVTADTALRLGKFFKTGAAFWMNMQARFDLETAEDALAPQIKKIASCEELRREAAASRLTR